MGRTDIQAMMLVSMVEASAYSWVVRVRLIPAGRTGIQAMMLVSRMASRCGDLLPPIRGSSNDVLGFRKSRVFEFNASTHTLVPVGSARLQLVMDQLAARLQPLHERRTAEHCRRPAGVFHSLATKGLPNFFPGDGGVALPPALP
eukprot:TRINITY_DN3844_c0_g1_i1.p4 TRINITY_DN3844_c0_g1~~TRINITY_DN3844_c0_g1_i1.p4  ORF type:complete len:145 (-),score=1.44 TRINITY_DN3844_c0_g1_i1:373-807(-)